MVEKLTEKFTDISRRMQGNHKITEKNIRDAVEEVKIALLDADVNVRVVRRLVNSTIKEATGDAVLQSVDPGQQFIKTIYDKIVTLLGSEYQGLTLKGPDVTSVILMAGLQGSGKTTTAAKLAALLKKEGRRPLLVACDLFRPAAVEQLTTLGKQIDVPVFAEGSTVPEKRAAAAIKLAKKEQYNTVIVDTTGRMEVDGDMMDELGRIEKALSPDEVLFVADAMTGQKGVEVAKAFNEKVELSGVILTKFDSDTRGGAALSIKSVTGKPIKYMGMGEKIDQLEPFYPERIASRILGMGDVVSLVEKVQEQTSEVEAEKLQKKIVKSAFTLEDYLEQFQKMRSMGSMQSIMEMIPGMAGKVDPNQMDEKVMKRQEAIILSMTIAERRNYLILGPPRRKRIAKGSGTSIVEVNRLLKDFEKMRIMMKKMVKNKKMQASVLNQMGLS